jgi:hypothetical protein
MSASDTDSTDQILANLDRLLPDIEALYKDVHAHPELSMQEERTSELAASRLRSAGYEVTTGVGKTGVVGLLRNGDGPTVMLRADMDVLPIKPDLRQRAGRSVPSGTSRRSSGLSAAQTRTHTQKPSKPAASMIFPSTIARSLHRLFIQRLRRA